MNSHLFNHYPFQNILIILMGSLGDVVRGLSVADGLKEAHPGTKITWLVEPKCKDIVHLSPSIDKILVFNRNSPLQGIITLYKQLKDSNFDLVLDMQRHFKSGFFSFLTRSKTRIGFHPKDTKELNFLFNNKYIPFCGAKLNKFIHYQKFLEILNIPSRKSIQLIDTPFPKALLNEYLGQDTNKIITLVLGSSWESKNWVKDGYCALIKRLKAEKVNIILVGDFISKQLGDELSNIYNVISLVGSTTIKDLVAILRKSACVIGPDSGPGHIASLVGTPYISLFGPTDPERVSPYGSEHLVVKTGVVCSPCYKRRCPGLNKICMRLIAVDDIMRKFEGVVGKSGERQGEM